MAEAYLLRDHKAPMVAKVLVEQLFSHFRMPYQLPVLSGQGPEFGSNIFLEMCRWIGIDEIRMSPYWAACSSMLEQTHRTVNMMLAKIIEENHSDWDTKVQFVMATYRASIHNTTGFIPNFLALG